MTISIFYVIRYKEHDQDGGNMKGLTIKAFPFKVFWNLYDATSLNLHPYSSHQSILMETPHEF